MLCLTRARRQTSPRIGPLGLDQPTDAVESIDFDPWLVLDPETGADPARHPDWHQQPPLRCLEKMRRWRTYERPQHHELIPLQRVERVLDRRGRGIGSVRPACHGVTCGASPTRGEAGLLPEYLRQFKVRASLPPRSA